MGKYKKTHEDFLEDLKYHLESICAKCIEFDKGNRIVAREIGGKLSLLLKHKGRNFKSLLHQLGLRDNQTFISSAEPINHKHILNPLFKLLKTPITVIGYEFYPNIDSFLQRKVAFNDWYEEIIIHYRNQYSFSRKDIIETLRDQYESHADSKVEQTFFNLLTKDDYAVFSLLEVNGILQKNNSNPLLSNYRQIAHELICSLYNINPEIIDFNKVYFDKIGEIKPSNDIGNYLIRLISKDGASCKFYEEDSAVTKFIKLDKNFQIFTHKENFEFSEFSNYLFYLRDDILSDYSTELKNSDYLEEGVRFFDFEEKFFLGNDKLIIRNLDERKNYMVNEFVITFRAELEIIKRLLN